MLIISSSQCRAARGLLGWSQSDLAQRASTHIQTISSFEKDTKIPTTKTLTHIRAALELSGVEFQEDGGIRPSSNRILSLSGRDGIIRFFDLVYEEVSCSWKKADLCVTNAAEDKYSLWLGDYRWHHYERMIKYNYHVRALVKHGDHELPASAYAEYRWISQKIFSDVSIYHFGEKTAFLEFSKNNVEITIVDNPAVTRTMRKLFELSWEVSHEIPTK